MSYELELKIEQTNRLKNEVIQYTAEGKKPSEISRLTGLSLREQREINDEFKQFARSSQFIDKRAKEIIAYGDMHFQSIIDRLNDVYESATINGDDKLRADILTRLATAEKVRIEFLQKAGIVNDQGVGAELAKAEARQEQIVNILREIKDKFPDASNLIRQRLMELDGITPSERTDVG